MKFISGTDKEFYDFLDSISQKDNVAIISHSDLDGLSSAILLDEMLSQKKINVQMIIFIDFRPNMFRDLIGKLDSNKINKVLFSDVSETSDYEGFKQLDRKYLIFSVDHHFSDIKAKNVIKSESTDCATFVLYELGKDKFNLEKWKWLVYATMVSEFSYNSPANFQLLKKEYPDIEKETIMDSIPGKRADLISSGLIYSEGNVKKIYDIIKKEDFNALKKGAEVISKEYEKVKKEYLKKAEYYPDKNLYFYYSPLKFNISSAIVTDLSVRENGKTFMFASDVKGRRGFVKVGSRNQGGKVDLNILMKKGITGLENATAGGHAKASGASFMKKDLERFKQNILNL